MSNIHSDNGAFWDNTELTIDIQTFIINLPPSLKILIIYFQNGLSKKQMLMKSGLTAYELKKRIELLKVIAIQKGLGIYVPKTIEKYDGCVEKYDGKRGDEK